MYTILPLALALTAVAAPWGPNGGAGSHWGFQDLEWLPVAWGAHALPGSHAHSGGLPSGAGKAQVPRVRERGFAIQSSGADETNASAALKRGIASVDDEAKSSAALKRGMSEIETAGDADETNASAVLERGTIQITSADETNASAVQERGLDFVESNDGTADE